jgi:ATP-dependent exoDNAse (exonuclease V) alpha subunit
LAILSLNIKSFGRSAGSRGSRATSAAAYRAGERIHDERTGATYNHSARQDVLHKELVLPASAAALGAEMSWARDRATLWNAAEHAEVRSNARVAREYMVALPHELDAAQRRDLARAFAHEIADRYHNAVDLVIHAPRGDTPNFHAHLLTTTREVSPAGLGPKTAIELSETQRRARGLLPTVEELRHIRERWATLTNGALEAAHVPARVSHLSLQAQGLDREPGVHLPTVAWHIEQSGRRSTVAERIRAAHQAKLERARAVRLEGQRALAAPGDSASDRAPMLTLEEVRARARERWLTHREQQRVAAPESALERNQSPDETATPNAATAHAQPDDDLGL